METSETVKNIQAITVKRHKRHEHPKVSVIVPVYKVDKYLTQCLNSIVNQTMEELEIIIVDEGDHDRCREIIDFFEAHDPRIIAPHRKNGGYGASCNLGMDMARGEYLAIVESDDYIEPEMYEEMYAYAKALDADVVKTPYSECFANGEKHDCPYRRYIANSVPLNMCFSVKEYGALMEVHASLWSGLYRTNYMRENNIKFIQAKGGAYVDLGFRIDTLINTNKIVWIDKPFYNYRVDSEGSTSNNYKISSMLERWDERHTQFLSDKENYDKYYGPHLIIDEYYNTFCKPFFMRLTKNEFKKMQDNLAFIDLPVIEKSPCLNTREKAEILMLKKHPNRFKVYAFLQRLKNKYYASTKRRLDKLSDIKTLGYAVLCYTVCMIENTYGKTSPSIWCFLLSRLFLTIIVALVAVKIIKKIAPIAMQTIYKMMIAH